MKKTFILFVILLFSIISFSQTTPGDYTIKLLESNSKNSDFGPTYQTESTVIFSSSRGGGKKWKNKEPFLDLFEATINEDGSFSNIKKLPSNINGKYHESSVSFTPNKKTVYFTKNNDDVDIRANDSLVNSDSRREIKQAKKDEKERQKTAYLLIYRADVAVDGEWSNITSLPFNNRNYSVAHPAVSRDGSKLYFASDMPGAYGGQDIFVVDILANGKYSKPRNMGRKVNTLGSEMFPYIDSKNNLYFSSDSRKGGFGGLDIYAVKVYADNTISDALHLGEPINSNADDFGYALNNDIDQGYVSSNREGGKGSDDIYHLSVIVPLKFECTQFLTGTVKSTKKDKPISKVTVTLYDKNGTVLNTTTTNGRGIFKFDVPCDSNLKVGANKSKFEDDFEEFTTGEKQDGNVTIALQLKPVVICKQTINGIVKHAKTGSPISNAFVRIVDNTGKDQNSLNTDSNGGFTTTLPCKSDYKFTASKLKFMQDFREISTKKKPKKAMNLVFNLKPEIDTTEVKIVRNKVIVNINPIYFELNKDNINKDAAIELEKVVAIMKKYPDLKIEGGSHTDSRSTDSYNFKLSDRRAASTIEYIISHGINASRITAKGYGESQPVNRCVDGVRCSNAEHAENRRTEFVILNPGVLGYIDE